MLAVALDIAGQLAVVVGGGQVAFRKAKTLLDAGARVRVVSPGVTDGLRRLPVEMLERPFASGDTVGAMLVVAATGRPEVDAAVAAEAKAAGRLVTVSGDGSGGNAHFTAEVRRGRVSIAVSTGGASPALAQRIRAEVERAVGPEYGQLADLLAEVRERVRALKGLTQSERAHIYEAIVNGPALQLLSEGKSEAARAVAHHVVEAHQQR